MMERHDLDAVFQPRSVAVVGASSRMSGPGDFVGSLIDQGCPAIYPINPKATEIAGLPAYPTLTAVPGPVDHVISAIPAAAVPGMLEDAGAKGVRSIHFFTAGFAETGLADRAALQDMLIARARELDIRLIGPNCMGLYVPRHHIAFGTGMPTDPGRVAFFSQSGTHANEVVYNGALRGLRFSKVVSFGNAVDIDAAELCAYARTDAETEFVGLYLEGLADARPLLDALRTLAAVKPVALLKGGLTEAGGRSTQSHTASLAGSGSIWRAVARQVNAVLVDDMAEMEDVLVGWQFDGVPTGPRVALVVGGGGLSVQGADDIQRAGLQLPELAARTQDALRKFTPLAGTGLRNPVDTVSLWRGEGLADTVRVIAQDPAIDVLILQLGMGWAGSFDADASGGHNSQLGQQLIHARRHLRAARKTMAVVIPPTGDPRGAPATAQLISRAWQVGYPTFASIRAAARTLARLNDWRLNANA
jgi:acyl-CoA synthetase (NDP forming)